MPAPARRSASGTTPLALDGAPVLALHTDVPLYRDLTAGDRGEDVSALQRELARLGQDLLITGRFDAATGRGLQTLEKQSGFPAPDRSLSRADILWLPAPSVSVGAWSAVWGASAQAGETLGTLPGALTAVTLTPRPTALTPGTRTLTLWGQKGPLDDDLRSTDPDFLARLSATTDYRVMLAATEDNRQATGSIALDEPISTVKVPAAAVFGVDGSRGCIQSPSGAQAVEVVGAALGATLVTLPAGAPTPTTVRIGAGVTAKACR
ncbi:hypothetical protein O159_21740 [Leifsonia xyli subsp. cynodontis DSM 46306]|uniref:Peptidoglycan binding-like domain-containing protein n=1 Tax=Leifsonia xyli subsp. cynodontis DSM 46306 TaxID=1389489 RepID=U3P779_LEIXC|nr:peptidoglycan-binding domain-containing protein [Leifsonia xyli]AGW42150.1 hypothetical protein O159_21740 [Leifsonia xyli subsp. cynodontis DSM 46306]